MKIEMKKGLIDNGTDKRLVEAVELAINELGDALSTIAMDKGVEVEVRASKDEATSCQLSFSASSKRQFFDYTFFMGGVHDGKESTHTTDLSKKG